MTLIEFIFGILASIVATAITTYWLTARKYRRYLKTSVGLPTKHASKLGSMIKDASVQNIKNAPVAAKTIVSVRDDLASTLTALGEFLNSDIDYLNKCIAKLDARPMGIDEKKALYDAVQILNNKWPIKEEQMGVMSDKLLLELGFSSEVIQDFNLNLFNRSKNLQ